MNQKFMNIMGNIAGVLIFVCIVAILSLAAVYLVKLLIAVAMS